MKNFPTQNVSARGDAGNQPLPRHRLKLALTERFGQDTFVTVTIRFRFLSRRFQI
jgi:hypothetical protein